MTTEEIRAACDLMREEHRSGRRSGGERFVDALEAALLFHSGSPWDEVKAAHWVELTGVHEATTKALCDFIRSVLI